MSLARLCIGLAAVLVVPEAPWFDQGPAGNGDPKLPCAGTDVSNAGADAPDGEDADALGPDGDDNDWAQGSGHALDCTLEIDTGQTPVGAISGLQPVCQPRINRELSFCRFAARPILPIRAIVPARSAGRYSSCTIELRNTPILVISTSIVSPGFIHSGGFW
jgi:hypothetical protein